MNDLYAFGMACKRFRKITEEIWSCIRHTCLDTDLAAISRMFPSTFSSTMCRFCLPPDNLWAHNRDELDILFPDSSLQMAYSDLAFLTRKCTALESITLLCPPYKSYRVPAGRSFFRFLSTATFASVSRLDLTMTSFELADLELCQHSFSFLKDLCVDKCCIYVYRHEMLLTKPKKELKSIVMNFHKRKRRIPAGAKLLLATVADIFPDLSRLSAKSTEYRSNGCISYGYGEDEPDAVYDLLPRQRRRSCCAALLKRAIAQSHNRMQIERA
uniref:F-box domain-containing protein n=1 Tax=Ascaris lumbricoides TaxID=6252 RepID=A0A0M3IMD2_ASCLU